MGRDLLDLHGVAQDEVLDLMENFMTLAAQKGLKRVRIMTGKGKGLVQKKAVEYLKHAGYHWSFEKDKNGKVNEGVLTVFMD